MGALHVTALEATNVKRLSAVAVELGPGLNVVSGRNGAGKTSLLDALFFGIGGAEAQKATPKVIRDGEQQAQVKVTLAGSDGPVYLVTRTWRTEGKGTLSVHAADGTKVTSPQRVLDDLLGPLSFDPLAFASAKPADQLRMLLDLVDLPFDPAVLAGERAEVFEARTEHGRHVRHLEARLAELPLPQSGTPDQEVSTTELLAEFREAQEVVAEHAQAAAAVSIAQQDVETLRSQLAEAEARLGQAEGSLGRFTAPPDLAAIEGRLLNADTVNAAVRAKVVHASTTAELADAKAAVDECTMGLAEIDRRKAEALASATLPLPGLAFDDDGVLYRGAPFSQASGAERLRVSLAMAMAAAPTLRLCRITDGSLLDPDGLDLVAEMAAEHGFQVVVERVAGSGGPTGIVIEDGEVQAEASPAAAAAPVAPDAGSVFGWLDGAA